MFQPRAKSLYWTFAGAFLIVLVAGTLLQAAVIVGVVHPWMRRLSEEEAQTILTGVAVRIAALDPVREREVEEILSAAQPRPGTPDGFSERPEPGPNARRFLLAFRLADGRVLWPRPGFGPGRGRPGFPPGGPPRGGPPDHFPPEGPEEAFAEGDNVLARRTVPLTDGTTGEVLALARPRPFRLWPEAAPRPLAFFLPVALALSGVAALVLFRVLVRRLRRLEDLAARVAAGDLDARVEDGSRDEIGRLGQRLNRMTEGLKEARERLEASDRQRKRLLADISHELATPLTSIRGFAETLQNPDVPVSSEERSRYLCGLLEESQRMDRLVQDLLDLARLEARAIPLERVRLDWNALVENTVHRFRPRFEQAGLALDFLGTKGPALIEADGRRMEQVVENLLGNALRYVPQGGMVTVTVQEAAELWRLVVVDDGPGVDPQDLQHVFDRFYRADAARSTEGTGLGLAIVKEIVTLHGGAVSARANTPTGLVVEVELPARTTSPLSTD